MSFLAKLQLDGGTYNVLHCNYEINQGMDATGKPSGTIQTGQIELEIESSGTPVFQQWAFSPNMKKSGVIIFYRRDMMQKLNEVSFEEGYCVHFREEFDANNTEPMKIILTISAKIISAANVKYENTWDVEVE